MACNPYWVNYAVGRCSTGATFTQARMWGIECIRSKYLFCFAFNPVLSPQIYRTNADISPSLLFGESGAAERSKSLQYLVAVYIYMLDSRVIHLRWHIAHICIDKTSDEPRVQILKICSMKFHQPAFASLRNPR